MINCSFVIPFSTDRIDNLQQTIRFLSKDVIAHQSELILVCQTNYKDIQIPEFQQTKTICLELSYYCRAKMCNTGVAHSQAELVVLLDSDRILPPGYFSSIQKQIKPNQCVTTWNLWQLRNPATDHEIIEKAYDAVLDEKSRTNEMHKKGMFSGNTVLFKKLYLSTGGMDESFVGYGYQDIDFGKTMESKAEFIFRNDEELHLFHEKQIPQPDRRRSNVWNGIKYCRKWRLQPEPLLIQCGADIGVDVVAAVNAIAML